MQSRSRIVFLYEFEAPGNVDWQMPPVQAKAAVWDATANPMLSGRFPLLLDKHGSTAKTAVAGPNVYVAIFCRRNTELICVRSQLQLHSRLTRKS